MVVVNTHGSDAIKLTNPMAETNSGRSLASQLDVALASLVTQDVEMLRRSTRTECKGGETREAGFREDRQGQQRKHRPDGGMHDACRRCDSFFSRLRTAAVRMDSRVSCLV
eukprot:COSAG02_NODE_7062_length_3202_cov_25.313568_1_plen_111_part_00